MLPLYFFAVSSTIFCLAPFFPNFTFQLFAFFPLFPLRAPSTALLPFPSFLFQLFLNRFPHSLLLFPIFLSVHWKHCSQNEAGKCELGARSILNEIQYKLHIFSFLAFRLLFLLPLWSSLSPMMFEQRPCFKRSSTTRPLLQQPPQHLAWMERQELRWVDD